jgi:hypothetical protein
LGFTSFAALRVSFIPVAVVTSLRVSFIPSLSSYNS